MTFNSLPFIIFLGITFFVRFISNDSRKPLYLYYLATASTLFYAWDIPAFLLIFWFVIVCSYYCGHQISINRGTQRAKIYLVFNIIVSLSVLIWFKYFDVLFSSLFNGNVDEYKPGMLTMLLPIGISFYTFQSISYTMDVYRKEVNEFPSFFEYYIYISFFPQLIAGPIVKAKEFLYQLRRSRRLRLIIIQTGVFYLIYGFFLKVVVADNLAFAVDRHWDKAYYIENGTILALSLSFLFSFQIFADFAGYSFVALGIGYILGFRLPKNFDYPYIANSFSNFWRRWHISLSTWLKEYLYFPLGGNRCGSCITFRNLFIVMLLGGLWHGGHVNFLIWGSLHGLALVLERLLFTHFCSIKKHWLFSLFWFFTVQFVVLFAWIFFRTDNLKHALLFNRTLIFGWSKPNFDMSYWQDIGIATIFAIPVLIIHGYAYLSNRFIVLKKNYYVKAALCGWMLLAVLCFYGNANPFLYFQF